MTERTAKRLHWMSRKVMGCNAIVFGVMPRDEKAVREKLWGSKYAWMPLEGRFANAEEVICRKFLVAFDCDRDKVRKDFDAVKKMVEDFTADGHPVSDVAVINVDENFPGVIRDTMEAIATRMGNATLDGICLEPCAGSVVEAQIRFLRGEIFQHWQGEAACEQGERVEELKLRAKDGDAEAQYQVGQHYESKFDDAEAAKWWRLAAEQGHAMAQYKFGWYHEYGRGATKNLAEAETWYRKAAEQGVSKAWKRLANLGNTNTRR